MSSTNKLDNQSLMENPNYENSIHIEIRKKYEKFCDYKKLMKQLDFFKNWKEQLKSFEFQIPKDEIFYRARLFYGKTKNIGKFKGYNEKNSFIPPKKQCKAGRLNFAHKPYLYIADKEHTAILEVRPRLSEKVSVAEIQVKEPLKILNFTSKYDTKNQNTRIEALIDILSMELSKPLLDNAELEYIPMQVFASIIKNMGYDGIAYHSSMTGSGINYCIFNYRKCIATSSDVYIPIRQEMLCQKDGCFEWVCGQNMEYAQKYPHAGNPQNDDKLSTMTDKGK